jgi:hypothetical protein
MPGNARSDVTSTTALVSDVGPWTAATPILVGVDPSVLRGIRRRPSGEITAVSFFPMGEWGEADGAACGCAGACWGGRVLAGTTVNVP